MPNMSMQMNRSAGRTEEVRNYSSGIFSAVNVGRACCSSSCGFATPQPIGRHGGMERHPSCHSAALLHLYGLAPIANRFVDGELVTTANLYPVSAWELDFAPGPLWKPRSCSSSVTRLDKADECNIRFCKSRSDLSPLQSDRLGMNRLSQCNIDHAAKR